MAEALARKVFKFLLADDFKDEGGLEEKEEERGSRELMDACKQDAMVKELFGDESSRENGLLGQRKPEDLAAMLLFGKEERINWVGFRFNPVI